MTFSDFKREQWVSYLAKNKVIDEGILKDDEQEAYDKFLMNKASDERKRNLYHKMLQKDIDKEILRISDEEKEYKDLDAYKVYAKTLREFHGIEDDEILNQEFEW